MKLSEIQDLIKLVAKSGVNEVQLETKDIKLQITSSGKKGKEPVVTQSVPVQVAAAPPVQHVAPPVAAAPAPTPAPEAAAAPASAPAPAADDESKYITIKSPMIGTFYRSPSPDKPTFVEVGDEIAPGKVLCIIEAMKLFNEVEAEVSGKIVKVLVDDVSPIEYDQPLFLVDPS